MEKNKKSTYLIFGSLAAFVVVILVALFVPSPLNFNKDDDTVKGQNKSINPMEIEDNNQAMLYLIEYPEETNDFVVHFDTQIVSSEDFYDYLNFFEEYNYSYTMNSISAYVDDYILEKITDLPVSRNFTTTNWKQEMLEFSDTLREIYSRYLGNNNVNFDLDYFDTIRVKNIILTTSNESMYNFLMTYTHLGFSFYEEGNEQYPIVFYYE